MTTIKTTCSQCGDVMLSIECLRLELAPRANTGTYTFTCPLCETREVRTAGPRVVMVLLAAGVGYDVAGDSGITESEIDAFTQALDETDAFLRLLGA